MLHMKLLFAGRPHARIEKIDVSRALALPGVVAVLTGADVPSNAYGLAFADQPVLCDQVVRFEGDQVAAIVAETEAIAAQARDLVRIDYIDLPAICDPRDALEPNAPQLHPAASGNVLHHIRIRKGDAAAAMAAADVVVKSSYYVPMQEHAYLQPEAGLAYMDGDTVVVETAGQWAHHDQRQIAQALLPARRARAGDLPVHRGRIRRPGRHVGAGGVGRRGAADGPAGQDRLVARGVDTGSRQAAPDVRRDDLGRDTGG